MVFRRFLIIDDERLARESLANQIRKILPSVVILEAANIDEARSQIFGEKLDGIFLDLQMPGGSGSLLLPELNSQKLPVVLVTGCDKFACEAFDFEIVDYLLKPFDNQRLSRCLARLRTRLKNADEDSVLLFNDQNRCWPIYPDSICLIEASGSYITIHTKDSTELTLSRSLREILPLLDENKFVQANRSQIVRIDCLK